jgi:hypothetical protein
MVRVCDFELIVRNAIFTFSGSLKSANVASMASRTIIRYSPFETCPDIGLITQPLVGAISDRSRLRWGFFPPLMSLTNRSTSSLYGRWLDPSRHKLTHHRMDKRNRFLVPIPRRRQISNSRDLDRSHMHVPPRLFNQCWCATPTLLREEMLMG